MMEFRIADTFTDSLVRLGPGSTGRLNATIRLAIGLLPTDADRAVPRELMKRVTFGEPENYPPNLAAKLLTESRRDERPGSSGARCLAPRPGPPLANGAAARIMGVGIGSGDEQMAEQYELRKFLRHVSNEVLKEYFDRIGWKPGVEWKQLTEGDIDPLFEAIRNAPDVRSQINGDFRQINELATEGGIRTIIDEGQFRHLDLGEALKSIGGFHNKVLRVFLDHPSKDGRPTILDVARRLNKADNLPGRSWRTRSGVPEVPHAKTPDDEIAKNLEAGRKRLADALASYYQVKEGRGYGCEVHHFERDDRLYWFAYVRDYDRINEEWEGGVVPRKRTAVFEIIFMHSNADHSLDIFVKADNDTVAELRTLWARAVLGTEDLGTPPERGVEYELNILKTKREFSFSHTDGIREVRVSGLRLSLMGDKKNRRITLEAKTNKDPTLVFDLMDQVFKTPGQDAGNQEKKDPRLSLDVVNVTQAIINFVFAAETRSGTKTITARVSYPNSCSLKYEPKEEIARKYLREWKIDVSQRAQSDPQGA